MIRLTPAELECLLDRPHDCIVDVYCDSDIENALDEKSIWSEVNRLYAEIGATAALPENPTEIQKWILHDMVDGSTWVASHSWDADEHNGTKARACKTARSVAAKVSRCIGHSIDPVLS